MHRIVEGVQRLFEDYASSRPVDQPNHAEEIMSTIDWSIREIKNDIESDLAIGVMGRGTGAGMNSRACGNWQGGETWSNGFKALCDIGLTVLECENGGIGGILRSGGVLDTIGQALEGVIDDLGDTIPNYQLDAKSDGTSHPHR